MSVESPAAGAPENLDDLENTLTEPATEPAAELAPDVLATEAADEPVPDVTVESASDAQSAYDEIRARLGDEGVAAMDSYWGALHDDGRRHEGSRPGRPRTPEQQAAFEKRVGEDIENRGPAFKTDFDNYSTARTAAEASAVESEPVAAEPDSTPETDGEKITRLEAENTALREEREQNLARISQLEGQVAALNDRVTQLEARLGMPSPDVAPPAPTGNPALDAELGARARNGRERNGTNGVELGPDTDLRRTMWEKGTATIVRALAELEVSGVDVRRRNIAHRHMQSLLEQAVSDANLAYVARTSERDVARTENVDLRRQLDEERAASAARAAASPDTPPAPTPEPGARPLITSWPDLGAPTRVFPVTGEVTPPTGNPALDAELAAATTTVLPAAEAEPVTNPALDAEIAPAANPALDAEVDANPAGAAEVGANPALDAEIEGPLVLPTPTRRQRFGRAILDRFGLNGGTPTPPAPPAAT
jgi:hypothetical protein